MTTIVRRILSLVAAGLLAGSFAVLAALPAAAQSVVTARDEFGAITYGGNDGTRDFAGPWVERGENDGPGSGVLRVAPGDRCTGGVGYCLELGRSSGAFAGYALERAVDLDDATEATLTFRWRRNSRGQVDGALRLRISQSGGSSWTTLATIPLAGSQSSTTERFDITPWTGTSTVLRFEGVGDDIDGSIAVDDVQISATIASTTSTTTPPTSTTTTQPGNTTSTTTPPTSTVPDTGSTDGAVEPEGSGPSHQSDETDPTPKTSENRVGAEMTGVTVQSQPPSAEAGVDPPILLIAVQLAALGTLTIVLTVIGVTRRSNG